MEYVEIVTVENGEWTTKMEDGEWRRIVAGITRSKHDDIMEQEKIFAEHILGLYTSCSTA